MRSTMGKEIQEIMSLESAGCALLSAPHYGALSLWTRPTFTSGQPYLMLLERSGPGLQNKSGRPIHTPQVC